MVDLTLGGPLGHVIPERVPHLDTISFVWSTYQRVAVLIEG